MPTLRALALLLCACSSPKAAPADAPAMPPTPVPAPEAPAPPAAPAPQTPADPAPAPAADPPAPEVPAATLDVVQGLAGALDTSHITKEGDFPPLRDHIVPVGFSPDGHFAVYTEIADEAVGGYLWSFKVVDLETDAVLGALRWDYEGLETIDNLNDVLAAHGSEMRDLMKTHGITGAPGAVIRPPATLDGHRFEVKYDRTRPEGAQDGFIMTFAAVSLVRDGHAKRLGRVEWMDMAGCCDVQPPFLVMSPYEPRGALLVPVWNRGWEGPPHVLRFSIVGAHLNARFPE